MGKIVDRLFYGISFIVMALSLSGCGKEEIDFRQTENINGLIFKVKHDDPFTGVVLNSPLEFAGIFKFGSCSLGVKNGLLDGVSLCTSNDGVKVSETNYKIGKKDGIEKKWDARNGELTSESEWSGDKKNGPEKVWVAKNLVAKLNWVNGKETGYRKSDSAVTNYVDGELNGKQKYFFKTDDGKVLLEREDNYLKGRQDGIQKRWNRNGVLVYEENLNLETQSRTLHEWNDSGKLIKESVVENGSRVKQLNQEWEEGKLTYRFDQSGNKIDINGSLLKQGKEQAWSPDGRLIYEVDWDNGKPEKGFVEVWVDGIIRAKASLGPGYSSDIYKNGMEKAWDSNGRLIAEVNWTPDSPSSIEIGSKKFYHKYYKEYFGPR